ncbi:MAG TPA: GNAT family protein [Vicinamibacterales bacterium]|nr:GNAT family protein [Vicinamibacterales bacterium]
MPVSSSASDWRQRLPLLRSGKVTLRELRTSDAQALWAFINTDEVRRYLAIPPATVEGFERFISWTHRQRAAGLQATLAVTVEGFDSPVGLFQLREIEPGFGTGEWGFAIGSAFWGTGVFRTGAQLMMHLAFDVIGVHRLEARACLANVRGNAALKKIGAVQEGVLRRSFQSKGEYFDQALWTVLDDDWRRQAKVIWGGDVALN